MGQEDRVGQEVRATRPDRVHLEKMSPPVRHSFRMESKTDPTRSSFFVRVLLIIMPYIFFSHLHIRFGKTSVFTPRLRYAQELTHSRSVHALLLGESFCERHEKFVVRVEDR